MSPLLTRGRQSAQENFVIICTVKQENECISLNTSPDIVRIIQNPKQSFFEFRHLSL